MGRLAKHINADIDALERGDTVITESPIGDRGEPRPPISQPNGRILLRLSRREHEQLVYEAAEQGVSLNHYLTEIVCGRQRIGPASSQRAIKSGRGQRSQPAPRKTRS